MTRRLSPALFAAIGVTASLMVVDLVGTVFALLSAGPGPRDVFGFSLLSELGHDLMIGLGVFLVFWLLVPITAGSTVARAIGGGSLAAAGGAILVALSDLLEALVFARQASGSLYDLIPLDVDPLYLVGTTFRTALQLLPLTVLAAVLVREWLRSRAAVDAPKGPVPAV